MADEAGIFEQLKQAVMDGDEDAAVAAANAAVAAGMDPQKAIMEGLAAGMAEMGRKLSGPFNASAAWSVTPMAPRPARC